MTQAKQPHSPTHSTIKNIHHTSKWKASTGLLDSGRKQDNTVEQPVSTLRTDLIYWATSECRSPELGSPDYLIIFKLVTQEYPLWFTHTIMSMMIVFASEAQLSFGELQEFLPPLINSWAQISLSIDNRPKCLKAVFVTLIFKAPHVGSAMTLIISTLYRPKEISLNRQIMEQM